MKTDIETLVVENCKFNKGKQYKFLKNDYKIKYEMTEKCLI